MRKIGRTRQHIKYLSCVMAAALGLLQPCAALAVDAAEAAPAESENVEEDTVNYITAFEALADEDAYFSCMYKPGLEELASVFPETLSVWLEGEDSPADLEVAWECEDDFDGTLSDYYIFYPKWNEELYVIADSARDSVEIPYITVEVPVESGIIQDMDEAKSGLQDILDRKNILALVYLCDKYEVKEEPSEESGTVQTVVCGQSVQITDVELDEYGYVWYRVLFYQNATEYKGYIEKGYLATSDEDFADWEDTYLNMSAVPMLMTLSEGCPDVDQFPASYQNALYALKEKHPNWIFVRMDTGLDWNTVIAKEMGDKSLVPSSSSGSWQNGVYGQGWSYASEGILKYYMDPRNFLTDPSIFQFEQLTFNGSYHTTSAVQEILKSSFMSSTIPGDSQTYAQAFTGIGQNLGISPFHLASRVLQEQGTKGTSALISGSYAGYEGYYNYFNVSASGKTDKEVVESGLKKAVAEGWNTRYRSLYGGAALIGANYILKGQDTLYLEKFNVSNGKYANFTHQYMQNIQAPNSEASNIRKAYNNAGALENSFVFKIPVYNNMPASACSKPETTDAITLDKTTISSLEVNKTMTLIPYVNGSKVDYISNMTFTSSNTNVATVDSQGKITAVSPGTATISCTRKGANTATCTVTVVKANPSVSTPVLSPRTYQYGLKLSDIELPDGWEWTKGDTEISVGTFSYPALYTPDDTTKYNAITKEISFTITKAIPNCQMPEKLEAESGTVLGDVLLPDGFTWESDSETELKEAGEYTFYVSYNPDENNYFTVEHIPVIVHVVKSRDDQGSSGGSTSSGSTTGGSSSSGSTTGGSTSSGSTSSGGTSSGSSSSGSTTGGSTSSGSSSSSSTSSGSSSGGSTTGGSTSSGSTSGGSTSSGSTSGGSTSSGSTSSGSTSGGSTSSGSTSGGSTSSGSASGGSTSSGSTSNGSTSSGTTSGGSTSSGSTSNGSTSGGSTSSGSTSGGSTSSGSTSGGSTSSGSTSGSSTSSGSTSSGATSGGSTSSGRTSNGSTSSGAATGGSTSGGSTTGSSTTNVPAVTNPAPAGNTPQDNPPQNNPSDNNASNGNEAGNNASSGTPGGGNTVNSNLPANGSTNNNPPAGASANNNSQTGGSANNNPPTTNAAQNSGTVIGKANNAGDNSIISESMSLEGNTDNANASDNNDAAAVIAPQTTVEESVFRPSVTMHMEDTAVLTSEDLRVAKEQNFNLVLNMGNYAVWSIDIDSVDISRLANVDMGITIGTENIPSELIEPVLDGNKYLEFTLAHSGEFGFNPVLKIALDPANGGKYANLLYYDSENGGLEFICASIIDADGIASFQMDHASSYVIIVSDSAMSGVPITDDSANPVVRWIIMGVLACMLLIIVGYGIFFFRRKAEEEDDDEDEENDEEPDDEDVDDIEDMDDMEDMDVIEEYEYEEYENDEEIEEEDEEEDSYLDDGDDLDDIEMEELDEPEDEEPEDEMPEKVVRKPEFKMINLKEEEADEKDYRQEEETAEEDDWQEGAEDNNEEDDWIEDEDWQEPEIPDRKKTDRFEDDHAEDDWIDDDEWNIENDWMDDAEWERKNGHK